MASALSSLTPFVQTYGSLFLPSAADYVTTSLFKHATSDRKAQVAGLAAGMGVLFFSGRQTSLDIGLTGAVLYLLYKVNHLINNAVQVSKLNYNAALQALEKNLLGIEKSFAFVSDKALDAQDPEFDKQFADLLIEVSSATKVTRAMWESPEFLTSIHSIMDSCKTMLFSIHDILEVETSQERNLEDKLQQMAKLLQDSDHVVGKKAFDTTFSLFNKIYRIARSKGYVLSLPNVQNSSKGCNFYVNGPAPIPFGYASRFVTQANGPHRKLNILFNETQIKLAGLLQLLYHSSYLTAIDETLYPGDYDNNNPDNPFRITEPTL